MIKGFADRIFGRRSMRMVKVGNEYYMRGELEKALVCVKDAINKYERVPGAYALLAKILMPGDDYLAILGKIHETLKPESYVEVGVDKGRSMKLIQPGTRAVGIDPTPKIEPGNETTAKIFNMFSDEFFESKNILEELDASRIGMAFIDGSHIFEQTLRDIINIEKYSDRQTLMVLHDCIPTGRIIAERKRVTDFWCGDVWKLVDCLKQYRPDLDVNIVAAHPSGLVLITGLDPTSTVLQDKYDEIEKEYVHKELEYSCLSKDMMNEYLPSEWDRVSQCLSL